VDELRELIEIAFDDERFETPLIAAKTTVAVRTNESSMIMTKVVECSLDIVAVVGIQNGHDTRKWPTLQLPAVELRDELAAGVADNLTASRVIMVFDELVDFSK